MKKKFFFVLVFYVLATTACSKENPLPENASSTEIRNEGGYIDPNGLPRGKSAAIDPLYLNTESGTSLDPSGKPVATANDAGVIIDPNGRPAAHLFDETGPSVLPDGKPRGRTSAIDPNGKGNAGTVEKGMGLDPNGKGNTAIPNASEGKKPFMPD